MEFSAVWRSRKERQIKNANIKNSQPRLISCGTDLPNLKSAKFKNMSFWLKLPYLMPTKLSRCTVHCTCISFHISTIYAHDPLVVYKYTPYFLYFCAYIYIARESSWRLIGRTSYSSSAEKWHWACSIFPGRPLSTETWQRGTFFSQKT